MVAIGLMALKLLQLLLDDLSLNEGSDGRRHLSRVKRATVVNSEGKKKQISNQITFIALRILHN